ncbi:MAG: alpha/beta fold hydrolase [Spartobacteria bacterium]|nr:alpha/beta fold hydrolase [Spartobacteria bacterium]
MTPLLRLGIGFVAVGAVLLILWFAGDALYARRVRARAARHAGHASVEPFALNPAGAPALLLVHGFADGPAVFAKLAPRLAADGFAVRALHLTGFGNGPDPMAGVAFAAWQADLDREIAALRAENPDRPIWLVGHSLGGALAYDAALRPANRVAGLVLLAPLVQVSRARSPVLSPRQWFGLLDRLLVFTDVVESRLPKDLRDPAARAEYQTDKFIHRAAYRALFAAVDAVRPRAAEWRGPLFMAIAPSDQIVDSGAARFFFGATNAAPAHLVEVHAAGHVLPLDYGHEQLAAKIARFIRAAPPAAP